MPRATLDRPAEQFFWEQVSSRLNVPRAVVEGEGKAAWLKRVLNYYPFPMQELVHNSTARIRVCQVAKKGGKSTMAWAEACWEVTQPGRRGWIAASIYDNTDKIFNLLWNEVLYHKIAQPVFKDRRTRLCELAGGGMFKGRSWDNEDALEQESLDFILIDEAQKLTERVWEKLYARTTDRNGWILAVGSTGTSEEDTFWGEMCAMARCNPGWEFFSWPTSDNPSPVIQAFLGEARNDLSPEAFAELYECVARKKEGLVFTEYDPLLHIKGLPLDPTLPVEVFVDPGKNYAVSAVQSVQQTVHVVDEVYMYRPMTSDVILECKNRPWWPKVVGGVIDVAGRQHHNERSQVEIWQNEANIFLRSQFVPIDAGIDRLKTFLVDPYTRKPRIFFDPKCRGIQSEFRLYQWSKGSDRKESRVPIDRHCHSIKAIIYGLVDRFGFTDRDLTREGTVVDYRRGEGAVPDGEGLPYIYELPYFSD